MHIEKPWGFFDQFTTNEQSTVKIITINSHHQLSLQSHLHRDELWIFLDKDLIAEVGDKEIISIPNRHVYIPQGTKHRLKNDSDHNARILEISFGNFDENDIIRYEDKYGREDIGIRK